MKSKLAELDTDLSSNAMNVIDRKIQWNVFYLL